MTTWMVLPAKKLSWAEAGAVVASTRVAATKIRAATFPPPLAGDGQGEGECARLPAPALSPTLSRKRERGLTERVARESHMSFVPELRFAPGERRFEAVAAADRLELVTDLGGRRVERRAHVEP